MRTTRRRRPGELAAICAAKSPPQRQQLQGCQGGSLEERPVEPVGLLLLVDEELAVDCWVLEARAVAEPRVQSAAALLSALACGWTDELPPALVPAGLRGLVLTARTGTAACNNWEPRMAAGRPG
jgi:hypothetical protein